MRPHKSVALLCVPLFVWCAWSRAYHYSLWSDNSQAYLEAIRESSLRIPEPFARRNVRAGIVTHHFLASGMMVRFFERLRDTASPGTIILIGPNHFHHGRGNISLSSLPWKTCFGVVETDRLIIDHIKAATTLAEDTEAFTGEHSVGVLIPLIHYYFPHSRVVPILIDVNANESQLRILRGVLTQLLRKKQFFLLLSMDFSHDSTAEVAETRDRDARQAISTFDMDRIGQLYLDCHKGLWLVLAALREIGPIKADIEEHSNSSRLSRNPSQRNVTSYFTICFSLKTERRDGAN